MLVLTRKSGESVRIGNDIIISVLNCSHGSIKLGITAPQQIPVHREEVYKRIEQENQAAVVQEAVVPDLFKQIFNYNNPQQAAYVDHRKKRRFVFKVNATAGDLSL